MENEKNSKKCANCKKEKNFKDFSKQKKAKDGLQSWCKSCMRSYHQTPTYVRQLKRTRLHYGTAPKYNSQNFWREKKQGEVTHIPIPIIKSEKEE